MSDIEKLDSGSRQQLSANEREQRREYYFRAFVQSHLRNTIVNSLEESGFSSDDIDVFTAALGKLPENDQLAVLSVPFEIRGRFFGNYSKKISRGQMTPADAVRDILEKNRARGFTLGYHLSKRQIPKQRSGNDEIWNISGSELDDRDDMPMAYYSEDYVNRYQKKNGKFLYIVRAETGENSSHKRDLKNHWGRAPSLSIIDETDMQEIERDIDEAMKNESATTPKM